MERAFFPPGTEINGYVIEIFLSQNRLGSSYLAVDKHGGKYILSILNGTPDPALEQDIAVWAASRDPSVSSEITFTGEPVPMIVERYVKGLSFEEMVLAGFRLSLQEAVDILRQILAVREDLLQQGAADGFINPESVILTADKQVIIRRANLFYGEFSGVYKKLADACFALTEFPEGVSAEEFKQRFLEDPYADLPVTPPEKKVAPPRHRTEKNTFLKKGVIAVCAFCLAAALAVPAVMLHRRKTESPEVVVQTLAAPHHSRGPVVHTKSAGKTVPSQTVVPKPSASQKAAVKKTPPKQNRKKRPRNPPEKTPVVRKRKIVKQKPAVPAVPAVPPVTPAVKAQKAVVAAAAKRGSLMELRNLIAGGADVNLKDNSGKTAMYYAAAADWKAMISLLYKAGAAISPVEINAAGKETTRRYMRSLLIPQKPVSKAVNTAPRVLMRNVPPKITGWKKKDKRWHVTLEHAMLKARPARKKIFVLFTGADWCGPCKMLESQILSSAEFRRLSKYLELVWINFPRKEKMPPAQKGYNEKLRRDLGAGGGVPKALILDHNGKKIGNLGGYRAKDRYISDLKRLLR